MSSSCTDLLRLNDKRLFRDIKTSLPTDVKETRNILEICDNVLYVWKADNCRVLTLNLAATRAEPGEDVFYQETLKLASSMYWASKTEADRYRTSNTLSEASKSANVRLMYSYTGTFISHSREVVYKNDGGLL
ncbi:hypothetical protein EAI_16005 [Harpegnathos saltator]|uniref:Uncharacterized protein n=1 Tax=Harpegnathos saltator TaxID=610380 RepID=E2BG53_HARSA|nr:hypothetical protein EAI_16005 [Harpegnathos saltator]